MTQRKTDAALKKQLQTVEQQLDKGKTGSQRRLDLLRKQAELGDERDAAITQARRAASERDS